MREQRRYAVITPYYNETKDLLDRCIRSVRQQTLPADHILVADGYPQDWIDGEPVRHIRLDRNHADFGDTPRALGAMLAVSEGYAGIALLDADNWLENNHIASCIEASLRSESCDYVIARRNLCRPDGSVIDVEGAPISKFVDTNCFFLLPGSYHLAPRFGLVPHELSPICDRIFLSVLEANRLHREIVTEKTVNYHCLWPAVYRMAGETPPPDANKTVNFQRMKSWLEGLAPRDREIMHRRCGFKLVASTLGRSDAQ